MLFISNALLVSNRYNKAYVLGLFLGDQEAEAAPLTSWLNVLYMYVSIFKDRTDQRLSRLPFPL